MNARAIVEEVLRRLAAKPEPVADCPTMDANARRAMVAELASLAVAREAAVAAKREEREAAALKLAAAQDAVRRAEQDFHGAAFAERRCRTEHDGQAASVRRRLAETASALIDDFECELREALNTTHAEGKTIEPITHSTANLITGRPQLRWIHSSPSHRSCVARCHALTAAIEQAGALRYEALTEPELLDRIATIREAIPELAAETVEFGAKAATA